MKIAIAELETQTELNDVDRVTGGAIVGGETTAEISINVGTDNPGGFAASDAFSFTLNGVELPYKPGQKFNITLVIGGGIVAEPVA